MSAVGITLFLFSSFCTMSWSLSRKLAFEQRSYIRSLGAMFFSNIGKNARTHIDEETNRQIFSEKKKFFTDLYRKSGIKKDCKLIHVAGTKGKGSTVEFITSGLLAVTDKVGTFTSPHLHTARERIKTNKELIPKSDITRISNKAIEITKNYDWKTFFDLWLTSALLYFGERDCEYMVLETGIGGKFDSTNCFDSTSICVITSISMDHQNILGDTLSLIAAQKAGIIKPNTHVFTPDTQHPDALAVIEEECRKKKATLHIVPISSEKIASLNMTSVHPVFVENACVASDVLQHMGLPTYGMNNFFWPCRMEVFQFGRDGNQQVVLDGCHNGDSVEKFLKSLRQRFKGSKIITLFGAGQEKSLNDMLPPLMELSDSVLMVQSKHFRSLSEIELIEKASAIALNSGNGEEEDHGETTKLHRLESTAPPFQRVDAGTVGARLQECLDYFSAQEIEGELSSLQQQQQKTVIAICGSLFTAAEAREHIFKMHPEKFDAKDWVRDADPELVFTPENKPTPSLPPTTTTQNK